MELIRKEDKRRSTPEQRKDFIQMNFYLIDYENVNDAGLNGIASLTDEDCVTIFYSEYADKMSFGLHRRLNESRAAIEYRKIITGTKNALDFQLSSYLGYLIAKHDDASFYIVSKDTGYSALKNIWQKSRIYCISEIAARRDAEKTETAAPERTAYSKRAQKQEADTQSPAPHTGAKSRAAKAADKDAKKKTDDVKKQLKKLFKDKTEAASVYEIIKKCPTKQAVNNELTKQYGYDSGRIYKKIKQFVKDRPGK